MSRSARQPSPTFAIGDGTQADAAVSIFHDVSQAQRMFSHISGEGNRTCLAEEVTKFTESNPRKGVKYGKVVTSSQVSTRPVGDESAIGRFTLPITDSYNRDQRRRVLRSGVRWRFRGSPS